MKKLLIALLALTTLPLKAEEPWRFINLSDWHSAEKFIFADDPRNQEAIEEDLATFRLLKRTYGGELLVIPGDSNDGKWDRPQFIERFKPGASVEEVVLEAGALCYGGMIDMFSKAGYPNIVMAVGDHEMGDNSWRANTDKARCQPQFREAFSKVFNFLDEGGKFKFPERIGSVPSRPLGTKYQDTSYAYKYKNVLFLTLDAFHQEDWTKTFGVEGSVTGAVVGEHLKWVERVLTEARKDPAIHHIIAQSHLPILYPVRKVSSSGMYLDDNVDSELWKVLRKHGVDLYLSGDVHANTVTKDPESDLLQVVTRGNFASNFQTVDVTDHAIEMVLYRHFGDRTSDGNYRETGRLRLEKSRPEARITATGDLALLDRKGATLRYSFEEEMALTDRPINGLDPRKKNPLEINGVRCDRILSNSGAFGYQYDALYRGVSLVEGVRGKAGRFTRESRMGVFAMGPLDLNHAISYAMWVKTTSDVDQVLVNTATIWGSAPKGFLNLYLENGSPVGAISKSQKVVADGVRIDDGKWHHLSLVMPYDHSTLSDLRIYVDGEKVDLTVQGNDQEIEVIRHMRFNIGCMGYGHRAISSLGLANFEGELDEVGLWTRAISEKEIQELARKPND